MFVDRKHPLGSYFSFAAALQLQSVTVTVKYDGNGAAVAASVLFDLAVYCRCSHLLLLLASCLPAPCQCLSMDYTLPACLHVALQRQPCLLAEQASLLEKHRGTNVKTASFPIKNDL